MDEALRDFVRQRAGNRCEYCQLSEEHVPFAVFHIEHIIARKHGGQDTPGNLALCCQHDNLHKGPNLTGIDSLTRKVVSLFHPRRHKWHRHFRWNGPVLEGLTSNGRATIVVLQMNDPDAVRDREAVMEEGVFPSE
jgi:hypothetical protein